jgi:hypothetical protein
MLQSVGLTISVADPDHFDTVPDTTFPFDAASDPDPIVGSSKAVHRCCWYWYMYCRLRSYLLGVPKKRYI